MDAANNTKRDTRSQKAKGKRKTPTGTKESSKGRKAAPFYKVMPGMPIAVDAFCYGKIPGVTAYFLSHAHSDHYTNLSSSWKNGPIYCSLTTGNLIKHMLRVDPKWVKPLPDNQAIEIPDTGGVKVTLIDANHCPGSSLFVFSGRQTTDAGDSPVKSSFVGSDRQFTYLHCGDFRACPAHALHPSIHGKRLDTVYLDTTYLNPKYCFPPQAMVIDACAELAKRYIQGDKNPQSQSSKQKSLPTLLMSPAGKGGWFKPSSKMLAQMQPGTSANSSTKNSDNLERILVVVGTYTIGKERVLKAIAKALSSKIYCNSRKHAVFMCQADTALHAMLTKDSAAAQVHVLPLGQISIEGLSEYLALHQGQYDRILGFRPTGWTYTPPAGQNMTPTIDQILAQAQAHKFSATDLRPQRGSNPRVTIYGVPYSEHSSFRELTCFALSTDWGQMIATVNVGSAESRQKMQAWFDKWAKARRDRGGALVEHRCEDYW
ncbi:DRMBL-domain-containing protein [Rhizoctonia solani]|nr:DRMBL-domain-containing protein [Rhizoctonia solani]